MRIVIRTLAVAIFAGMLSWRGYAQEKDAAPAGATKSGDKLDLQSVLAEPDEAAKAATEDTGPGDDKLFTVATDDDISSLATGDIYKGEKSTFKVVTIKSKSNKGGKFVVQRIGGKSDPARKWTRVSGLGPLMVVSRETMWDLYLAGGGLMHPIALCMVVVIIITLNSLWIYREKRQCPDLFVEKARTSLQQGDISAFEQQAGKEKGLFAHVCRAMATRFDMSTLDDIKSRAQIEATRQLAYLRAPLRGLNLIAAVAPLLGLLGTVTGMVTCFESLAFESASASKAQTLASGIRVALFTTVAGLCVAIPALFVLFVFNQKLTAIMSRCESLTEEFLHEMARMKRDTSSV